MNIYIESFELLNYESLHSKLINALFKNKVTEIRIRENLNGSKYSLLYRTFKENSFIGKFSALDIVAYIEIENMDGLKNAAQDIAKRIKSGLGDNKKLNIYALISSNLKNIDYAAFKKIFKDSNPSNDLMIINADGEIIWRLNDIAIKALSERNKFLLNEFAEKKDTIDIDLFKREFASLLIFIFKLMKNNKYNNPAYKKPLTINNPDAERSR